MSSRRRHGSESIPSDPLEFRRGALELEFSEFALDGDDEYFEVDRDGDTVRLTDWEGEWRTLTLRGELTIHSNLVEEVFPEDERDDPPAELVFAVDCEPTHLREGHESGIDDFTEGTRTVELTVGSGDHYGAFTVTPTLVRTGEESDSSTYRTVPGVELADGDPVRVEIDELEAGDDRLLPSFFKNFEESDSDRFPSDAVYVVDKSDLSRPKLFVNSAHEPIRDALKSGPRGYVGHVMMVYRDLIFLPALSELVLWTAEDVEDDGSTVHDWQDALLQQVGTEMYDVSDGSEAGERLYDEFREEEAMTTLLDRISTTMQDDLEIQESMNSLVNTLR